MEEISFPQLSLGFGLAFVENLVVGEVALELDAFFLSSRFPLGFTESVCFFCISDGNECGRGRGEGHATGTEAWKPNGPQKALFARENRT